ncbi:hypothetical protein WDD9_004415 [Paenibacillus melissococcoides]|nr:MULTISPECIES: hypothetical protein [Paenibacillus]MEB9895481.1 hypothetical protein [Bacillus cereus]GIO79178.1 hypothetical protein J6TS7_27880 [Paenibacillus dendritiformis]CAH8715055.1 hypothetical protein HTL2_004148 [Paenibacillus melissococcoides]CAH8716008.1 hypothetical protein WDD9_004415 [Paenibacillus melissococcoides]
MPLEPEGEGPIALEQGELFFSGKAAMVMASSWFQNEFRYMFANDKESSAFDWGMVTVPIDPSFPDETPHTSMPDIFGIAADSRTSGRRGNSSSTSMALKWQGQLLAQQARRWSRTASLLEEAAAAIQREGEAALKQARRPTRRSGKPRRSERLLSDEGTRACFRKI